MNAEPEINTSSYICAATFLSVCSSYAGYKPTENTCHGEVLLWLTLSLNCFKQILFETISRDFPNTNENLVITNAQDDFENTYLCVGSLLRTANEFGVAPNIINLITSSSTPLYNQEELLNPDPIGMGLRIANSQDAQSFFINFRTGMDRVAKKVHDGFIPFIKRAHGLDP